MRTKYQLPRISTKSIEDRLRSISDYNEETLKTITNIEKGKNLVKSKSLTDFFKKLGI